MSNIARIAALILLSFFTARSQQGIITSMEERAGSALYLYDGTSTTKILEDSRRVFENHRIKIAPNKNVIGVISRGRDFTRDKDGRDYIDSKLLVFSNKGGLKFTIPNVQAYAWSPDGLEVACILGRKTEGFGFEPSRLIVVTVKDSMQRALDQTIKHQDIYWASYDSMIYTTDFANVYQIDPKRGIISKMSYKGIHFSPDGKYYFVANYEGGTFGVYERTTGRDVTPKGYRENPAVNLHYWLPSGSTLVFGDQFGKKQVIDIATMRVKATVAGEIIDCMSSESFAQIMSSIKRYFFKYSSC